jgi:hypothetical protein
MPPKSAPGRWVHIIHVRGWDLVVDGVHVAGIRQRIGSHRYSWHLFGTPDVRGETETYYAAQRAVRRALRPAPIDATPEE